MNPRKNHNHPWKRIQTNFAFPAWAKKHPDERRRIEARYAANLKTVTMETTPNVHEV
jgi:hypothetical protein